MSATPTLGRIVHYRTLSRTVYPAIVSSVWPDGQSVNLCVFNDGATLQFVMSAVEVDPAKPDDGPGWFWPPRVP
jgi:hypothetical protein